MLGRLLTVASALSLVLCVATAVLWARSDWESDPLLSWYEDGRWYHVDSDHRGLSFTSHPGFLDGNAIPGHYGEHGKVPFFVAVCLTAAPSLPCVALLTSRLWGWITRLWRWIAPMLPKRQPVPGVCANCGYDLRATPRRCPECGTLAAGEMARA